MRIIIMFLMTLIVISCIGHENSKEKVTAVETTEQKDSLIYYWQPDYNIYLFDTVINHTNYRMKTYCLNDSAVYNESFSEEISKGKNLIEYSIAHNYATDFTINTDDNEIQLHLLKENFKDSLSTDFFKICHMWKNEFSHTENGQLIFRATFAKPDTDYQFAILYLITDQGDFKILKVEDETYNGSEDE